MRSQSLQYAERVLRQSSRTSADPLYRGDHLRDVAEYLNQRPRTTSYEPSPVKPFAHLYSLDDNISKVGSFSSASRFEEECEHKQQQAWHRAGLLWITGQATPEWLNALGGEFDISPLHLLEHLSFRPTIRTNTFTFPTVPSASTSILSLTIPTVGSVETTRRRISSSDMQELRKQCDRVLQQNSRHLESTPGSVAGRPFLRHFHLHDANIFSVEQNITISLAEKGDRWTLILLCDNAGDGNSPEIPLGGTDEYAKAHFKLNPVIQMNRGWQSDDETTSVATDSFGSQQSLALLPSHYGQMLDGQLATIDPFYALTEFLDFFVSAESQFINMMHSCVNEEVGLAGQDRADAPSLMDFQYSSEILQTHIARLKRLLNTLDNRESMNWPKCGEKDALDEVNNAITKIAVDVKYLISRVDEILARSERGKDIVLGNANLLVAKRSYEHNIELGQLTKIGTWVAMLYVPLSFITSVFGINVAEFGQGRVSVWVWAAASGIVLLASLMSFAIWRRNWLIERARGLRP